MKLRVNDEIICNKACYIIDTGEFSTTIGKIYKIIHIERNNILIIDDGYDEHGFCVDKNSKSYYGKWFSTVRLEKLKKLKIN